MKHTFRKCLSLVLALATLLSVCVVPLAAADEECDHYAYKDQWVAVGTQDPTCVEYGGEAYLCGKCGERFVDKNTWVQPLGHDKVLVEEQKPTNLANGWRKYTCGRCDVDAWVEAWDYNRCANNACTFVEQKPVYVDANGVSDPCDNNGTVYNKCSKCGWMEYKTTVAPVGHTWVATIKQAPVCGIADDPATTDVDETVEPVDGIISFTCTICKETSEDEVVKAASEHKLVWYDYKAPTCLVDGNNAGYKCEHCSYIQLADPTKTSFVIEAKGDHTYDPAKKLTGEKYPSWEATCVDGQEWYECTGENCDVADKIVKRVLKADVHGYHAVPAAGNNSKLGDLVDATCSRDAYRVCSECRQRVYDTSKDEYKAHHTWEVQKYADPTCTVQGYKTYLCIYCKYTWAENTPAIGHKRPETVSVQPATCLEPAYHYFTCQNADCPGEDLDGKPLANKLVKVAIEGSMALGHIVPVTGVTENPADCLNRGTRSYKCERTGCTGWDHTQNAAPAVAGYVTEYTTAAPLGHDWKVTVPFVAATCEVPGRTAERKCARCLIADANGGQTIPATGHTYREVKGIAANCLYPKHDGYICIECGHEDLSRVTNQTGDAAPGVHVYTKFSQNVVTPANCVDKGLVRLHCDICAVEKATNDEIPALGHEYGENPVGSVPASCGTNGIGYDVYFCTVIGCPAPYSHQNKTTIAAGDFDRFDSHYIVDATNPYTYDSLTGEFTLNAKHVTEVSGKATVRPNITSGVGDACSVYTYNVWNCEVCKHEFSKLVEDQYGPVGSHVIQKSSTAADCKTGTDGYMGTETCARCNKVIFAGVKVEWKHTYSNLHPQNDKVTAPTCTDGGIKENGYCTVCQANVTVPGTALGHKNADGSLALEWVEASLLDDCLNDKYDAHWGCALCDAVVNKATLVEGKLPTKKDQNNKDVLDVDKIIAGMVANISLSTGYNYVNTYKTHDFTSKTVVYPACLKDGYTWAECKNPGCSAVEVTEYKYGYANHRYEDMHAAGEKVPECADYCYYCQNQVTTDGTNYKACNAEKVVKEAKPHTNKYDVALVCTNWPANPENKADFYKCKFCEVTFTDGIKDERVHGDFDVVYVAASCTMPQHDLKTCTDCGYVFIVRKPYEADGGKMKDHDFTKIKENSQVYPTNWTGYYTYDLICSMCGKDDGKETKDKLAEVYFSMAIGNKYDAAAVLVNGSRVTVTINMSTPTTDIYSVSMAVKFNNKILEWVDTKEKVTNAFGYDVTEVYCDNNGMNTVEIYAHAESTADKKIQNVSVKGTQKLVTLEFEIKPTAYVPNKEAIKDAITFGDITVLQYDASVIGKEGYAIGDEFKVWKYDESATATDADKIKVATEVAYGGICYKAETNKGAYELKIMKLADLNGDGVVGLVDAGIFNDLMNGTKYNAQADLNKDGKINNADYILMRQYMVEKLSYAELTKR